MDIFVSKHVTWIIWPGYLDYKWIPRPIPIRFEENVSGERKRDNKSKSKKKERENSENKSTGNQGR